MGSCAINPKAPPPLLFDVPLRTAFDACPSPPSAQFKRHRYPGNFWVVRCHICDLYTPHCHDPLHEPGILCAGCRHHTAFCRICTSRCYSPQFVCWACETVQSVCWELTRYGVCGNRKCGYPVDGTSRVVWYEVDPDQMDALEEEVEWNLSAAAAAEEEEEEHVEWVPPVVVVVDVEEKWAFWKAQNRKVLDRSRYARRGPGHRMCLEVMEPVEEKPSYEELERLVKLMREEGIRYEVEHREYLKGQISKIRRLERELCDRDRTIRMIRERVIQMTEPIQRYNSARQARGAID